MQTMGWISTTITPHTPTSRWELPDVATVSKGLAQAGTQLMELRSSPLVPDFTGPVLFEAPAAASVLAQVLPPSLSGARPPLSMAPAFDQMMERIGSAQ